MLTTEANVRCAQSDSDVENIAAVSASLDFFEVSATANAEFMSTVNRIMIKVHCNCRL